MYRYSIMRAIQTIIGVSIAWVINVKLLPFPPKPGSLSYWLAEKTRKSTKNARIIRDKKKKRCNAALFRGYKCHGAKAFSLSSLAVHNLPMTIKFQFY